MATAEWIDPIVEEVREWRRQVMEEAGNDLGTLVDQLIKRQESRGVTLVDRQTMDVQELRERIRKAFPVDAASKLSER